MLSSKDLRDIENSPIHKWSMVDVEILNCLFRWYESSPNDMVKVFNVSTGRHLTKGKLRVQFDRGAGMTRKFQQSFYDLPFHDPSGRFSATRQIIEAKARTLNIDLRTRQTDNIPPYIKALKGRAANNHDQSSISGALSSTYSGQFQHVLNTGNRPSMRLFGGYAMRTDDPFDGAEWIVDVEGAPTNTPSQVPAIFARNQHLAFRVWSGSSGTTFSEKEGFVAGLHSMWNGSLLEPFQPEGDGLKAIMLLSNAHFRVESKFPSAFVSVASSLLHVLTKAFDSSSDIQYIFWADIPSGAIIHHFPLSELEQLARDDTDCGRVLGLGAFQPGRNTAAVASDLHKRNIILNTDVARAMGRIAKLFGLSEPSTKIAHISEWVSNFVASFGIQQAPGQDLHTKSSIAIAFAIALDSRAPSYHLQDVMLAFQSGVESGLATIAYFASRRRPKFDKSVTI
ncbi:hypothetical protein K469DRAFT_658225 [Zopfia rhizophila CBS 207.26]|uniref:DUF7587 domain-containing protein n=1 Tax=Zopfia rhizophila CBS 207.26 TaxID=1314779 RepID=A0A6A6EFR0_9PEZI|nr:hypothetical protein K469DRAFT_658225 [Zopfia rhizophila CBS 207.26]